MGPGLERHLPSTCSLPSAGLIHGWGCEAHVLVPSSIIERGFQLGRQSENVADPFSRRKPSLDGQRAHLWLIKNKRCDSFPQGERRLVSESQIESPGMEMWEAAG